MCKFTQKVVRKSGGEFMGHIIRLPLSVVYSVRKSDGKERSFSINLNDYRQKGTKFFILNTAKQKFHEMVKEQIEKLPVLQYPIRCRYTVFKKDCRAFDVNNVCAIADKFFMDALVEYGKLPDDNYKYYLGFDKTSYGGVDKCFPCVEVEILENVKD
jgi:hypothetical protein